MRRSSPKSLQHPEAPTDPFPPQEGKCKMALENPHNWDSDSDSDDEFKVQGDEIPKYRNRVKKEIRQGYKISKKPNVKLVGLSASASSLLDIIDTFDRPGEASAVGPYAESGSYAHGGGENEPGKRIPKVGAYAGAGVGKAKAEFSVFEAEAKGPNASAAAEAKPYSFGAIARAELGSVSAAAGPLKATLGLGVDTGVKVAVDGIEAKILGTGIRLGPNTSVSVLGSELSCVIS
uniref:Uncharacterized protein n=1 Tax=Xenopus tropicalis TaxID=8364 RepID=A0A6I8SI57_XENTR